MVEMIEFRGRWLGVCGDLVLIAHRATQSFYIASRDGLFDIGSQSVKIGEFVFDPKAWFEPGPLANFSVFRDIDEIASYVQKLMGERLRGKRIAVSFSGGKDSVTMLAVLKRVCERIGCSVYAIYIHMPFIEPLRYVREVERLARVLGVELVYGEPPRRLMIKYLKEEGLPYRRSRWCTYLKTRRLRQIALDELGCSYVAIGDRVWENLKRFSRLYEMIARGKLYSKKLIYPIAPASLCDVISVAKALGALHEAYAEGCLRVSCLLCPYKSILEISRYRIDNEVEDPGLIFSVIKEEWRRWYADAGLSIEEFVDEALWRFVPRVARMLALLKGFARTNAEATYSCEDIRKGIAHFMTSPTPCQYLGTRSLEIAAKVIKGQLDKPYVDIVELANRLESNECAMRC